MSNKQLVSTKDYGLKGAVKVMEIVNAENEIISRFLFDDHGILKKVNIGLCNIDNSKIEGIDIWRNSYKFPESPVFVTMFGRPQPIFNNKYNQPSKSFYNLINNSFYLSSCMRDCEIIFEYGENSNISSIKLNPNNYSPKIKYTIVFNYDSEGQLFSKDIFNDSKLDGKIIYKYKKGKLFEEAFYNDIGKLRFKVSFQTPISYSIDGYEDFLPFGNYSLNTNAKGGIVYFSYEPVHINGFAPAQCCYVNTYTHSSTGIIGIANSYSEMGRYASSTNPRYETRKSEINISRNEHGDITTFDGSENTYWEYKYDENGNWNERKEIVKIKGDLEIIKTKEIVTRRISYYD